jgi:hypothetical protein
MLERYPTWEKYEDFRRVPKPRKWGKGGEGGAIY